MKIKFGDTYPVVKKEDKSMKAEFNAEWGS